MTLLVGHVNVMVDFSPVHSNKDHPCHLSLVGTALV